MGDDARVLAFRKACAEAEELGNEIARISANVDATMQRLMTCIRNFDESGEWYRQGCLTCAHWLMWRIGLTENVAREKVRVARALGRLPQMDAALGRGELSYAKVRAMTRVATPENEAKLLHMAAYMTGDQLEKLCRLLRRVSCNLEGRSTLDELRRVEKVPLPSGLVKITMILHADEAALVMKAIDKAREEAPLVHPEPPKPDSPADVSAETSKPTNPAKPRMISRPDAVMKMAESFLATGEKRSNSAERYQVFLHVQQDPLGQPGELAACLDDGTRVSAETLKRITCDCCLVAAADGDDGNVLNLGRRQRVMNPALRRALQHRDGGCRYPGCTNKLFVSGHHIKHWLNGGETNKKNVCLLCLVHHHLLHEGLFTMEGDADGELIFKTWKGLVVKAVPEREHGSYESLLQANRERELDVDEETNVPGYDGDPIQWGACVDAFC